jgi:hypothetical protein
MGLSAYLSPGIVSIYGVGSATGVNGMLPSNQNFLFGLVDQVGDGNDIWARVGDSVMFNKNDVRLEVHWNGWWYTLIEQDKIVLTEAPVM